MTFWSHRRVIHPSIWHSCMVPRQKSYIAPISSALDIKIHQYLFLRSVPHVTCRATSKNNSRVTKSPNSHQHEANLKTLISCKVPTHRQRCSKLLAACHFSTYQAEQLEKLYSWTRTRSKKNWGSEHRVPHQYLTDLRTDRTQDFRD